MVKSVNLQNYLVRIKEKHRLKYSLFYVVSQDDTPPPVPPYKEEGCNSMLYATVQKKTGYKKSKQMFDSCDFRGEIQEA